MKRISSVIALAALSLIFSMSCSPQKSKSLKQVYITRAVRLKVAEMKAQRSNKEKKLQSGILELIMQYKANGNSFTLPDSVTDDQLQPSYAKVDDNDNIYFYIYHQETGVGIASNTDTLGFMSKPSVALFSTELQSHGVFVTDLDTNRLSFTAVHPFVQGWIPANAGMSTLKAIDSLSDVAHIALVTEPLISGLIPPIQGSTRIRSDVSQKIWGNAIGDNVRVGIISDDCGSLIEDNGNKTTTMLQDQAASADNLPSMSNIQVVDDSWNGGRTHEGLAMMEIVHNVAPHAYLAFATGYGKLDASGNNNLGMMNLSNAIDKLAATGCNVITDDILYLEEPAFEDGPVAQNINARSNIVFTSAAGNWAKDVYSFTFDALPNQYIGKGSAWNTFTIHDNKKNDYKQQFMIPPGKGIEVMLQWDDPYMAGTADDDFDLYLVDVATNGIVEASTNVQDGGHSGGKSIPFEHLTYFSNPCYGSQGYKLYITRYASGANPTPRMKLLILGTNDYFDPPKNRSIFGHSAASNCISCAAMNAMNNQGNYNTTEDWSSRGPVEIVDMSGTIISGHRPSSIRLKPDVASIEGISTKVPNFDPFGGTSASAPHVAGIAAMLMSSGLFTPKLTAMQVENAIRDGCIDYDDPGWDSVSGYGRTDAFKTMAKVMAAQGVTFRFADFMARPTARPTPTSGVIEKSISVLRGPSTLATMLLSVTIDGTGNGFDPDIRVTTPGGTTFNPIAVITGATNINIIFGASGASLPSPLPAVLTGFYKPASPLNSSLTIVSPMKLRIDCGTKPIVLRDWGVYRE